MPAIDKEIFKLVLNQLNHKYSDLESKSKLIEESFYLEHLRLQKKRRKTFAEVKFYKKLQKKYLGDEKQVNATFRAIIKNHLKEIQGNFSFRIFKFVQRILTLGLKFFINEFHPIAYLTKRQKLTSPKEKIHVFGFVDKVVKLSKKYTIIVVPNHVSNFDSVVLGYGLVTAGLPTFYYGAGLNLFTNPFISFFMHNLGAYKVDRDKRHLLYKEILKAYSVAMLQLGNHSLFFPGGTRLRSGGIEKNLKMGLLGTAITAYSYNLLLNQEKKKLIFVPVNLNYQVVMEAQSMMKDYLAKTGQEKYMGDPPGIKRAKTVFKKIGALQRLDTEIYIHIGEPLDILGNHIDDNGESFSTFGKQVDLKKYFLTNGKIAQDENRDQVYTRFIAKSIEASYEKYNVITRGNLVLFAIFRILEMKYPDMGLFKLLYLTKDKRVILIKDLIAYLYVLRDVLLDRARDDRVQVEPGLLDSDPEKCLEEIEKKFTKYYYPRPFVVSGYQVQIDYMPLVIYYYDRIGLVFGDDLPDPEISNEI